MRHSARPCPNPTPQVLRIRRGGLRCHDGEQGRAFEGHRFRFIKGGFGYIFRQDRHRRTHGENHQEDYGREQPSHTPSVSQQVFPGVFVLASQRACVLNCRELRFGETRQLRAQITALGNLCKDIHHGSV